MNYQINYYQSKGILKINSTIIICPCSVLSVSVSKVTNTKMSLSERIDMSEREDMFEHFFEVKTGF